MSSEVLTKQVSVFLENKSGRLAEVCQALGEQAINIRALCIADTSDFGILRLIVDKPDPAVTVLQDNGFWGGSTGVLARRGPEVRGGRGGVLAYLQTRDVNVEYMYAFFITVEGDAVVLFKVADAILDSTLALLSDSNIPVLAPEEVYNL